MLVDFAPWKLVDGSLLKFGLGAPSLVLLAASLIILWGVSMMQERFSVREAFAKQNLVFRWTVLYLAIFSILIFGVYGIGFDAAAFIYTQY